MKIRQLLKTRKQWTRNVAARDKYGHEVLPQSKKAVRWCLFGALLKCYPTEKHQRVVTKKLIDDPSIPGHYILWNDAQGRKFSEVKELIEKLNV